MQMRVPETIVSSTQPAVTCSRPVRVGVLLDSQWSPRWVKQVLDDIRLCSGVVPYLLVVTSSDTAQPTRTRNGDSGSPVLLRIWTRLDNFFRADNASATAPVHLQLSEYGDVFPVHVSGAGVCSPGDLERVEKLGLTVIVNLATSCPDLRLPSAAQRGIWRFAPFDSVLSQNNARFFWQQLKSPIVTDCIVEHSDGAPRLVHRAFVASDPESPYRAQNGLLWRRSAFLVQRLCALGDRATENPPMEERPSEAVQSSGAMPAPSNLQTARILAGVLANGAKRIVQRQITNQHWFIALRQSPNVPFSNQDMKGFRVIRSPRNRYYADPFVIEIAGKQYVFVEDYRTDQRKGVISYFVDDGSQYVDAKPALETEYHLSYPFLFRWNNEIFMLPETSGAGRIEAFRAVKFPDRWEPHAVLLDNIVGYDPTLLEYDGKFWLFLSGVLKYGAQNNDLSIFYADHPFGSWHPHPGNPVVSDPLRARPAGAVIRQGGHLYRPGQDCWGTYGRAITVNRIEELSETQYREVPVGRIEPKWLPGITGTHTFNDNGRLQVIDGRIRTPRWRA